MLSVYGYVALPADTKIKEYARENGTTFYFEVLSEDPDDPDKYHSYPVKMWVKAEEVDKWREKLTPKSTFYIQYGEWTMRKNDKGFARPCLTVWSRNFRRFATPKWVVKNEE